MCRACLTDEDRRCNVEEWTKHDTRGLVCFLVLLAVFLAFLINSPVR